MFVDTAGLAGFMEVRDDGYVQIGCITIRQILEADPSTVLPSETIAVLTRFVEGTIIAVHPKR